MDTIERVLPTRAVETQRTFSLVIYLLLVFGLSWPFQIAYALWGASSLTAGFWLSSASMVMVAVGTFLAGRYIFHDTFRSAGWSLGKPRHYVAVFALALLIFLAPVLIEALLGIRSLPVGLAIGPILGSFLLHLGLTVIPGFGEEFGWRAYLMPRLAKRYGTCKGLLLHGLIWWAWHIPAICAIGAQEAGAEGSAAVAIAATLMITLIPSTMNAVLYGYIWTATQSLAVASVYHSAYDEVRDAIEQSIGLGPLASIWEMACTTILGAVLLWKGNWKKLGE